MLSLVRLIAGAMGLSSSLVWLGLAVAAAGAIAGVYYHVRLSAMAERNAYWQVAMAAERNRIARENEAARRRAGALASSMPKPTDSKENCAMPRMRPAAALTLLTALSVLTAVRRLNRLH